MKLLGKYWKLLLAVLLLIGAAVLYFKVYQTEKAAYEAESQQLNTIITAMQANIAENKKYKDIQDELEGAKADILESRLDLYEHFPVEMKEEDQIMYVLYLETLFDEEIMFPFSDPQVLTTLQDGSNLVGLVLQVNYKTTYEGFQEMINYLATDSRIVSVYEATIDYNANSDVAQGYLTLLVYLVEPNASVEAYAGLEYRRPDVAIPEVGKDNIFE